MITQIQNALVNRLALGLGKLATVKPYAGELDDKALGIQQLPLVLVSYGGSRFEVQSSRLQGRYQAVDCFVVIVITRSLRDNVSAAQGGFSAREIGSNQLLSAIKYLLINQTLSQLVSPIKPLQVQTLWNNAEVKREKLSAYAMEFEVRYDEQCLEDGCFPEGSSDKTHPEWIFSHYQGQLSPSLPWLKSIVGVVGNKSGFKVGMKEE